MASDFKLKAVSGAQLTELVQKAIPRGRSSQGQQLVEEFLSSGDTAATVSLGSDKERNALAVSAANFVRSAGHKLWIRKTGPTELLLVNLSKAPAAVMKAYENRPRVGRQPKK